MRTRLALVIAGALGLVLMVPIVVVVALGAYGELLGGSTTVDGPGSASLSVQPARVTLGQPISVSGRGWSARDEIVIYAHAGIPGGELPRSALALATVQTSRSGSFEFDAILGQSLFAPGVRSVVIVARPALPVGGEGLAAELQIVPYPNSISITVLTAPGGAPLAEAIVNVADAFNRPVATGHTGPDGRVTLEGLPVGPAVITVQLQDYLASRTGVRIPDAGEAEVVVKLRPAPGLRLHLPAGYHSDDGETYLIAIDRASGLPVESRVMNVGPGTSPLPDFARNRFFSYIVSAADIDHGAVASPENESLAALAYVGRQVGGVRRSPAAVVNYVGESPYGQVIYTTGGVGALRIKQLYVVGPGPDFDISAAAYALGPDVLMPVLVADERSALLVDWRQRTLVDMDLATGSSRVIARELPELIRQVVRDPYTDSLIFLSAAGGGLYRFDLATLELVGEPLYLPGAEYISAPGDGRLLIVVPGALEIVSARSDDLQVASVVPTLEPLYWVWTAPGEPFVYAGRLDPDAVINLHLLDADSLLLTDRLDLPYGMPLAS